MFAEMETAVLDQRIDSKPNTNPVIAIVIPCYRVRQQIASVLVKISPEASTTEPVRKLPEAPIILPQSYNHGDPVACKQELSAGQKSRQRAVRYRDPRRSYRVLQVE